jgi:hypothetical protein
MTVLPASGAVPLPCSHEFVCCAIRDSRSIQQAPATSELGAEFNQLISLPDCVVSLMPGEAFPNGPICSRANSFKLPQKEENKG